SSPSLPVSETRQTGQSDAATAGARILSTSQAGDGPDPSVIMAALNRVAEEMGGAAAEAVHVPPAAQPLPDLPPAAFSSPSSSFSPSFSSDFGSGETEAASKPAGWDPIRVSSAWPALTHTPMVAEPPSAIGVPGGAGSPDDGGAPWGTAVPPWAEDSADTLAPASLSAADPAVAGTGLAGTRPASGASAPVTAAGATGRGGAGRGARIAIVLAAVVLLCVVVLLLVTVG